MAATAEYLAEHPFADPDLVNPPEAPTYRYRPDINSIVALAALETDNLSAGSRVDILIDNLLQSYVLQASAPTGSDLEVVPDDFDVILNQQYWLLVAANSLVLLGIGDLTFADIGGTLSLDQLPPGSLSSVESIDEDALYFYNNETALPNLISANEVVAFLSTHISFSDLSGTISLDQFPPGTVADLDSIDEDALYFFDNALFQPKLVSADDTVAFLSGHIGFADISGTLSVGQLPSGTAATVEPIDEDAFFFFDDSTGLPILISVSDAAALIGGGGGSSAWGDITGTLSDQTDLQAALDAKQPLDSDLTTIAGLTATTDNFVVSVSSAWSSRTPSQVRTTLGLVIGTNVQAWDADLDTWAGKTPYAGTLTITTGKTFDVQNNLTLTATDGSTLAIGGGGTLGTAAYTSSGAYQPIDSDLTTLAGLTATTDNFVVSVASAWASRTPSQVRTTLGLVIGTNVQAWDADLDTLAGLTATTDNFIVSVASAWASRTPAQVLATLAAVGTTFQPLDADLTTIAGLTATTDNFIVSVSSAWASRTPSQVRTTLGLVIGTNVQAWDADLDTLAGLTATTDNFVVSVSSAWASRTPAQVRTTLGLVIGTNVQAWDADLDSWAAITRASGFDTFATTPSSANLRSLMTDELGTGALLFDGPTLTKSLILATTGASLSPLNIPAGTLQSTPSDGDFESDGDCFYGCTDAGNRGYIPVRHFIRADSTVTQANDANAHAIFTTPTNGRLTLETGTYRFEALFTWTATSATSGNITIDFVGAGGASTGAWMWRSVGADNPTDTQANVTGLWSVTKTHTGGIVTGATSTTINVYIVGTFEVTGAGTIVPTQTLQNAAAAVLSVGSFFMCERIGSTSVTSVGQWD